MHAYASVNKKLPPGSKYGPGDQTNVGGWYDDHGWYSYVGPFIGEVGWAKSIKPDVSFSDPSNDEARRLKIPIFECPSDGMVQNEWGRTGWCRWRGNYAVNFGNTTYGQDKSLIIKNPVSGNPEQVQFGGCAVSVEKEQNLEGHHRWNKPHLDDGRGPHH